MLITLANRPSKSELENGKRSITEERSAWAMHMNLIGVGKFHLDICISRELILISCANKFQDFRLAKSKSSLFKRASDQRCGASRRLLASGPSQSARCKDLDSIWSSWKNNGYPQVSPFSHLKHRSISKLRMGRSKSVIHTHIQYLQLRSGKRSVLTSGLCQSHWSREICIEACQKRPLHRGVSQPRSEL